jgi:acyl carrier protein
MNDSVEQSTKDFILREFLSGEDPSNLTASTPLITTGILDSIATLKLVIFLEKQFAVSILAHEVNPAHMDTIGQIAELVRSKG